MQMTIEKSYQNHWDKKPKVTTHQLSADTEHALFTQYFKEFDNRSKYNNSVRLSIIEPDMRERYRTWVCDVNNYAEAGGDMW